MKLSREKKEYINNDIAITKKVYDIYEKSLRRYRRFDSFVLWPIRVIMFPIFFIIKIIKWTYK